MIIQGKKSNPVHAPIASMTKGVGASEGVWKKKVPPRTRPPADPGPETRPTHTTQTTAADIPASKNRKKYRAQPWTRRRWADGWCPLRPRASIYSPHASRSPRPLRVPASFRRGRRRGHWNSDVALPRWLHLHIGTWASPPSRRALGLCHRQRPHAGLLPTTTARVCSPHARVEPRSSGKQQLQQQERRLRGRRRWLWLHLLRSTTSTAAAGSLLRHRHRPPRRLPASPRPLRPSVRPLPMASTRSSGARRTSPQARRW